MRPLILSLVLCCLGWFTGQEARAADSPLRMASFNIQIFGKAKMKKAAAVSTILRILDRYDLVFIMEIRDAEGSAIHDLLTRLNAQSSAKYQIIVSERLGHSNTKEQYAYLYNTEKVTTTDAYVFQDVEDKFEREPYVAHFRYGSDEFTMVGIHAAPMNVEQELRALPPVYNDARKKYHSRNIFIVGDLNADCSYYKPAIGFDFFEDAVTGLVPESADTTVAPTTNCTYDRVLAFGDLPRSSSIAQPFNFQTAYGLTLAEAQEVSDHYPVEWNLGLRIAGSSAAPDEGAAVEALVEETPAVETPVVETPAVETSFVETPAVETPVVETPAVETSFVETPAVETPVVEDKCGPNPSLTPGGYCYSDFIAGRRRVANACCPQ